jgi:vacuolar iron transporter family protein
VDDDAGLARTLVLDELFDLSLYRALQARTTGELRRTLGELIPIETKHFDFWRDFFDTRIERLDLGRRLKLALIVAVCRLFGEAAVHLVLEAIEIHGVRKYLRVWEAYQGQPLADAVRGVLADEFGHEDRVVSHSSERRIDPERVRNVFLGFNDGLVEILGAVSGFFAAFPDTASVLIAGSTVAVAGSFSMAAGAFAATSSEREVARIERGKRAFFGEAPPRASSASPLSAGLLVGLSYIVGACVPILPVLVGAKGVWVSIAAGGIATVMVSSVLAFLSGMDLGRRLAMNAGIVAAAVAITYLIGMAVRALWGIDVG